MKTIFKISKNKLLPLVLVFSIIFSSLGVFAEDVKKDTKEDFSVVIGDYKYFSNSSNDYKLSRIELKDGKPIEGTIIHIFKTGDFKFVMSKKPDSFYCYRNEGIVVTLDCICLINGPIVIIT